MPMVRLLRARVRPLGATDDEAPSMATTMATTQAREFDVVIYGATGFTGGLVAEYFARHVRPLGVRWALAGRSMRKLEALRGRLERAFEGLDEDDLTLIQADASRPETLRAMCARAQVVLSTAGPFAELGEPLVEACIAEGADYVDITGEPEFWSGIIERHHEAARRAGVRLVPCCGFDSIPADLGVLYTVSQLPQGRPAIIEGFVEGRGAASGGTWHSAIGAMASLRDLERTRRRARRAAGGEAEGGADGLSRSGTPLPMVPHFNDHVSAWVAPLPTIDPVVVKRSALLRGDYGEGFRLGYYLRVGSLQRLIGMGVGLGALYALSQLELTRAQLLKWRARGGGPDAQERARSWFRVTFHARSGEDALVTRVSGGDPGYTETARMVSEAALCLVRHRDELPPVCGILTPASALGHTLIRRLQQAGLRFETLSSTLDDGPVNGGRATLGSWDEEA